MLPVLVQFVLTLPILWFDKHGHSFPNCSMFWLGLIKILVKVFGQQFFIFVFCSVMWNELLAFVYRHNTLVLVNIYVTLVQLVLLQGVCIGLSEVMASAGKHQLLNFMDELIPTIRTALCDRFENLFPPCIWLFILFFQYLFLVSHFRMYCSMPEVRESAGLAFSTLYKVQPFAHLDVPLSSIDRSW